MKKVSVHDIKQAMLDPRFRESLPEELAEDVQKFLSNPGCACNHPIYIRVMKLASKQVAAYYPQKTFDVVDIEKQTQKVAQNDWQVINCSIHELSQKLRELGPGRKQLDVARWQDQVTIVVNHLDGVY